MALGRIWRYGAGCSLVAGFAMLVAFGSSSASLADSGRLGQATATSPPATTGGSMAYDAATHNLVLFRGSQTWTWNGSTWTRQHPATTPPSRCRASMAYDAATRTVVLFGGGLAHSVAANDTWTWNGSNWAQQHPATSPAARQDAPTAYDGATHTLVLFG